MGRTAKRKSEAPSDAEGESQQRVTAFFAATKSRPRTAAAEEPLRSIENSNQQENTPRRTIDEDWRGAESEIQNQVSIRVKNSNLPLRPLSRLMAERISSAMNQSELPPEKLQQTCIVVRPFKRQASSDLITMYVHFIASMFSP
jgi:hypothetical protein